jgi:3-mercaptopyruvate sulfurtransferase SseA
MEEHTSARAAQILREKGYSARALLGGWAAWTTSGGETETAAEPRPSPPPQDYPAYNPNAATQQNVNTQQGQRAVTAPPSPAVDDSKTPAVVGTKKAEAARPTTAAQSKKKVTVKRKPKRHHRRTRVVH